MRKKINRINEITKLIVKKHLREAIEYDPSHRERMDQSIEQSLGQDTHPFGGSPSLPGTGTSQKYSEKLASKRFKDIVNMVKRYHGVENIDMGMMRQMMQIMQQVGEIEQSKKAQLEQLAIDIVSEEFDIPEDMLRPNLVPPGSELNLDDDNEEEGEEGEEEEFKPKSAERMKELDSEVAKRNSLNAMMQGAAKKGHYIFHQVADELDKIDPRLMGLYGKLMSLADYQYWLVPESAMGSAIGGTEKIKWEKPKKPEDEEEEETGIKEEEEPIIEAKAWIFPLLVHELIKGVMELAAMDWGRKHMAPDEQKHVIGRADTISGEIWGMRLGPGMWEKFLECINDEDYKIKHWLFQQLSQLPADKFHSFMKEILSSTHECEKVIDHLRELHQEDENDSLEDIVTGDENTFDAGLDDLLDDVGIAPSPQEDTPEDTATPEDVDYSEMSKSEIQKLIDDALDAGDIDMMDKLYKYL
jgi:hypothetical protein